MAKRTYTLAVSAALLLATALLPFPAGAGQGKVFSHRHHIEEEEVTCEDCHAADKAEHPRATEKNCEACHDEPVMGTYTYPSARKLQVEFPHLRHAADLDCASCHDDVAKDAHEAGNPLLVPRTCFSCHIDKKADVRESDCTKCHGVNAKQIRPADHRVAWKSRHGSESRWRVFDEHGRDCESCHRTDTCKQCHTDERPASHTGLWRMRSHGKAAEWDRDRCKTCHETGTCIECHRTTKPLNHTGMWDFVHGKAAAGLGAASCRACHSPGWCASCHRSR